MINKDNTMQGRAGRYILQSSGYRAFIPAQLPPVPPRRTAADLSGWRSVCPGADRRQNRLAYPAAHGRAVSDISQNHKRARSFGNYPEIPDSSNRGHPPSLPNGGHVSRLYRRPSPLPQAHVHGRQDKKTGEDEMTEEEKNKQKILVSESKIQTKAGDFVLLLSEVKQRIQLAQFLPQLMAKIANSLLWAVAWAYHAILMDKISDIAHRICYMEQALKHPHIFYFLTLTEPFQEREWVVIH